MKALIIISTFLSLLTYSLSASTTPLDYGALGDGLHDDTSAFQEALDTGNDVVLPEGTFLVSSITMSNDDQTLSSSSGASINRTGSSQTLLVIDANDCTISGINFTANDVTYVIKSQSNTGTTIQNCSFEGSCGNNIRISSCLKITIDGNTFNGTGSSITTPVVFQESSYFGTLNNSFIDVTGFNIQTLYSQNGTIHDNIFRNPTYRSVITATQGQTSMIFATPVPIKRYAVWKNNVVVDDYEAVQDTTDLTIWTITFDNSLSASDKIEFVGWRSLENININSGSRAIHIYDNDLVGTGDSGIIPCSDYNDDRVLDAENARNYPANITIESNKVRNCSAAGIAVTAGTKKCNPIMLEDLNYDTTSSGWDSRVEINSSGQLEVYTGYSESGLWVPGYKNLPQSPNYRISWDQGNSNDWSFARFNSLETDDYKECGFTVTGNTIRLYIDGTIEETLTSTPIGENDLHHFDVEVRDGQMEAIVNGEHVINKYISSVGTEDNGIGYFSIQSAANQSYAYMDNFTYQAMGSWQSLTDDFDCNQSSDQNSNLATRQTGPDSLDSWDDLNYDTTSTGWDNRVEINSSGQLQVFTGYNENGLWVPGQTSLTQSQQYRICWEQGNSTNWSFVRFNSTDTGSSKECGFLVKGNVVQLFINGSIAINESYTPTGSNGLHKFDVIVNNGSMTALIDGNEWTYNLKNVGTGTAGIGYFSMHSHASGSSGYIDNFEYHIRQDYYISDDFDVVATLDQNYDYENRQDVPNFEFLSNQIVNSAQASTFGNWKTCIFDSTCDAYANNNTGYASVTDVPEWFYTTNNISQWIAMSSTTPPDDFYSNYDSDLTDVSTGWNQKVGINSDGQLEVFTGYSENGLWTPAQANLTQSSKYRVCWDQGNSVNWNFVRFNSTDTGSSKECGFLVNGNDVQLFINGSIAINQSYTPTGANGLHNFDVTVDNGYMTALVDGNQWIYNLAGVGTGADGIGYFSMHSNPCSSYGLLDNFEYFIYDTWTLYDDFDTSGSLNQNYLLTARQADSNDLNIWEDLNYPTDSSNVWDSRVTVNSSGQLQVYTGSGENGLWVPAQKRLVQSSKYYLSWDQGNSNGWSFVRFNSTDTGSSKECGFLVSGNTVQLFINGSIAINQSYTPTGANGLHHFEVTVEDGAMTALVDGNQWTYNLSTVGTQSEGIGYFSIHSQSSSSYGFIDNLCYQTLDERKLLSDDFDVDTTLNQNYDLTARQSGENAISQWSDLDYDTTGDIVITGWAWDSSREDECLLVEIYLNGILYSQESAGIFSQSLYDAEKGNGKHVFELRIPDTDYDNTEDQIVSVYTIDTQDEFENSPVTLDF